MGVLAALGAPPRTIARTFRLSGLLLGGGGLVLGVGFGLLVCAFLTAFHVVRFPPEIAKVYYLAWMPFRPEPLHVARRSSAWDSSSSSSRRRCPRAAPRA